MSTFSLQSLSADERRRLLALAKLSQAQRTSAALPPISPAARGEPLPLSFAQQRLWFLAQIEGGSRAYHMSGGIRLRGVLDAAALRNALDRIIARHESLRTTFVQCDGVPHQVLAASGSFTLLEHDLGEHTDAAAQLQALALAEVNGEFDLARGPLIRGRLIRLAEREHVLLVTMHHIVSDGWSVGILMKELSALYAAFSQNRADPLPPLKIQYADYAVWQRRRLKSVDLQKQAEYWRHALQGAPEVLELPTDRPRPSVQSHAGAHYPVQLDATVAAGLHELSRRHGVTIFMTLLASWAAVLSRLSAQQDIVIGTPVANRTRAETEGLIGFFVNTQALRIDLAGAPTTTQLLERVKRQVLAAQSHQDIPFEQVVDLVKPARSLAHSPIFQAMLAWQNAPLERLELPGLQLEPMRAPHVTAQFDLSLSLEETAGQITGTLEYATTLFERSSVARLLGYWQTLLRGMIAADGECLERLPMLSMAERTQLLVDWNQTAADYPTGQCVHELFEVQAAGQPEAVAVREQHRQLSYRELNARSNQLARHLLAQGVRPDTPIAICMERCLEMVVALLGVLKAGAAYVPLDPSYPPERLAHMLRDSQAPVLLKHAATTAVLAPVAPGGVLLELDGVTAWEHLPTDNLPVQQLGLRPEHLAYIIYTSGSTGQPKGVMMPHRALTNLLHWQRSVSRAARAPRTAQFAALGFDVAFQEIAATLCSGGELVLIEESLRTSPRALLEFLQQQHIQRLFMPFTMLEQLANAFSLAAPMSSELQLPHLQEIITAGEQLRVTTALRTLFGGVSRCRLSNQYGPTETHVATALPLDGDVASWPALPAIGRPLANTQIYILDAQLQPVPSGARGEIYIGGAQVARGYLNRPELTEQRFLADSFSAVPGARMYKTGDVGRWQPDGSIEFLGRNDHQIKIRGFRIELEEIEVQLRSCSGVRDAVVIPRGSHGDKRLIAYLVVNGELELATIRTQLLQRLPDYMLPTAYVKLDSFPLSANGKLDRRALPEPDAAAFQHRQYAAPQGELESALAAIWQDVLAVPSVGRQDNFFELGGHSLLAVQMVARIRQALGVEIAVRDVFAHAQLLDLAGQVQRSAAALLPAIAPADRSQPVPLSFAQQRLWFLAQFAGASAAYHISGGVRLTGSLDRAALIAALDHIVARHEVLRTTLVRSSDTVVQVIAPPGSGWPLMVQAPSAPLTESELQSTLAQAASAPFDLEQGPLLRGLLIAQSQHEHVLFVSMHHVIADGWSIGLLLHELRVLYDAFSQGQPVPLAPLPIQYADFAVWQRRWLNAERLQQQGEYWRQALQGAPALLELPTDHARPAVQTFAGASCPVNLDPLLTHALQALSQRHGATVFMTLLASWAALLSRLSGQEDIVIGTPVANRTRVEVERLLGCFVNTQALRIELSGAPSVAELLARVKQQTLLAQNHQDIPFEQVVELCKPARSLAYSPLFQVMLVWQNTPPERAALSGLQLEQLPTTQVTAQFDLSLSLQEQAGAIRGALVYATALFERGTAERLLGYWQRLLQAMVADEQQCIARLPFIDAAERRQVLVGWNQTTVPYRRDVRINELFEMQAAQQPQAIAVLDDGTDERTQLTYRQLNERSNQLARHLVAQGVRPNTAVAICVERSAQMVVGLLAILKAGGAYVPLDPAYPAERLQYLLQDSAPAVLLMHTATAAALARVSWAGNWVRLDAQPCPWATLATENLSNAALGLAADQLAYVIYTSGSTGQPKGVMIEHVSVANRLYWMQDAYRLTPQDTVLQKTPFGFDVSVWEFFWTLSMGARLVMARPEGHKDPTYLSEVIQREAISVLHFVPSMLQAFLEHGATQSCGSVRYLICSGEALPTALAARALQTIPSASLHNLYGPTEATVDVTAYQYTTERHVERPGVPIGRPIANVSLYILDALLQPVPAGAVGELYIGGVQVARGYLNRPELTAQRFIADPFSEHSDARMYQTGDVCRWLPEGNIEYLGRNDSQVKIRGFRIELGEIEAQLQRCAGMREAAVVARATSRGEPQLVAYVVLDGELDVEALRRELLARVPEYMLPAAYVKLASLPVSTNGKLDRKALPAPHEQAYHQRSYAAPEGATEQALAEIWQDLLAVSRVGRHDNFFELGGHSLAAVHACSVMSQRFGQRVPPVAIYKYPTIAGLSAGLFTSTAHPATVVPLGGARDRQRLFLIHPAGGQISQYHELAQQLAAHFAIEAVQAPEVSGATARFETLEAAAAFYADCIIACCPEGPYRIAGWSTGGLLAHAVARELEQRQRYVQYLGLIDTVPVQQATPADLQGEAVLATLAPLLPADDPSVDLPAAANFLHGSARTLAELLEEANHARAAELLTNILRRKFSPELITALRQQSAITAHYLRLLAHYVPGALRVRPHFIWSSESAGRGYVWGPSDAVHSHISATHFDMLHGSRVIQLAAALHSCGTAQRAGQLQALC